MRFYVNDDRVNQPQEFLNAIPSGQAQKITWVLELADSVNWIPEQYFFETDKKDIWEIRITAGDKNYWLLVFRYANEWVLFNGDFTTNKDFSTALEINRAAQAAKNYKPPFFAFAKGNNLKSYVKKRKKKSSVFAGNYEKGFLHFKIGAILRQARQKAGLTQAEIAEILEISSSRVSRIENHAEDLDISSLARYVQNWSNKLQMQLTE